MRAVTRVAPLSPPLWAWLAWKDIARLRLDGFLYDVEGLSGSLRLYGPGLIGYGMGLVLFGCASALWFSVWASLNLFLRASPALSSDVARIFKGAPRPEIFASVIVLASLAAPVAGGAGIAAAAVFWIVISTPYLRRGELLLGGTAILLLFGVFLCGGFLEGIRPIVGMAGHGGWLGGEGYHYKHAAGAGDTDSGPLSEPEWRRIVQFARARAEMAGGDLRTAEALWSGLIREGIDPAGAHNNRGIVRVRLGKTEEGLADFETSAQLRAAGGRAQWNAYQIYLQEFRLEQAARIQPDAWAGIRNLVPFDYRAEEMTHGELVPSPPRVGDVWSSLLKTREEFLRKADGSAIGNRFFHPVPGKWVAVFLAACYGWAAVWKLLSRKIWTSSVCRSCGGGTLVAGAHDAADICNACGSQVGKGVRAGEEREKRGLCILLHRRYVRACSVLVPGAGALWAGKGVKVLPYGVLLSLSAGLITVSWGVGTPAEGLIADMRGDLLTAAFAAFAVLWLFGAAWGWRAFGNLQLLHNVSGERL